MEKKRTIGAPKGQQDRGKVVLGIILDIFVLLILVGQMLVYDDFYFNILPVKYYYFCTCTVGMLVLVLLYGFVRLNPLKIAQWHKIWPARFREWRKGKRFSDIFSSTDVMVLLFTLVVVISSRLSPFFYESFWGNKGRYTGAFLLLLNSAIYFCVTRFYKVKGWHIQMFLMAGMLMCLFGISDYFGMDLLHFKERIIPEQYNMFTSFIGNINTYTACVALVMAMAGVLFASSRHIVELIWYGICVLIGFVALITGQSDNAYLTLMAFFGFLPLYLFRNWRGVRRYLVLLAMFCTTLQWVAWTQIRYPEAVRLGGTFRVLLSYEKLPLIVKCLWALVAVLYGVKLVVWGYRWALKKKAGDTETVTDSSGMEARRRPAWFARAWWLVIIAVVLLVAYAVYDATILGNGERYGALQQYVQFQDSWGTSRGYAWRIAVESYMDFPLLQKIFGYGPDTFGLVAWINKGEEMVARYNIRFDSVHNEFLQIFVTMGPFGLLTYLGVLVTAAWRAVRRHMENPFIMGAMFAVACYSVQALVNINQPIATPIMWLLLCISVSEPAAPWKWPWKKK